jgi:acyl carrier protein
MTTHEMVVAECVYEILREHLGSNVIVLPESDLLNDLGMDSLEQIELGLKLEKALGRKIPIAELRSCVTVEEIIQLVQRVVSQEETKSA